MADIEKEVEALAKEFKGKKLPESELLLEFQPFGSHNINTSSRKNAAINKFDEYKFEI